MKVYIIWDDENDIALIVSTQKRAEEVTRENDDWTYTIEDVED